MKRLFVFAVLVCGLVARTSAGDFDTGHKIDWLKPIPIHGGIHGSDYWSSVTSNGQELGLIASRQGIGKTKLIGFGITYAGDIGIQAIFKQHDKWPTRVYRGLLVIGYGAVVVHNKSVR